MQNLTGLALVLSIAAVGVAGYALMQGGSEPTDIDTRLLAIEDQMARIERALQERGVPAEPPPTLLGLGARSAQPDAAPRATRQPGEIASTSPDAVKEDAVDPAASPEVLQELVDKAVDKKAAQMQVMRNKKPSIDVFSETLALTDAQRKAAEEEVVRAQHGIKEILEIPAEDGTNFMDELVEVIAHGMAEPGKNAGRAMKFFGRIMAEQIPGSDETYAGRIEGLKQGVRNTFRRNWTQKQYATFEAWRMDPTEVKDIPGSPWKQLETRIVERARDLGAKIPEKGDK